MAPGITQPGSRCERTVDFMSVFPTLCDLAGLPTPSHVQGRSIRTLLADPKAAWEQPALTTYLFNNHTVRTEDWRYIRYANGDEELYNDAKDPNEWTNLALKPESPRRKRSWRNSSPRKTIPTSAAPDGTKKRRTSDPEPHRSHYSPSSYRSHRLHGLNSQHCLGRLRGLHTGKSREIRPFFCICSRNTLAGEPPRGSGLRRGRAVATNTAPPS